MTLPTTIEEIDNAWLRAALGRDVELASDPEPLSSFACRVYRLRVRTGDGGPDGLIIKLPIDGPVRELLDGLGVYQREIAFYQHIAPVCPMRTPTAFVAVVAPESTDFVLLIEDLSPLRPGDQAHGLSPADAERAVDEIARFHAWSWKSSVLEEHEERFVPIDSPAGMAMQQQWGQFFGLGWPVAKRLAGEVSADFERFAENFAGHIPFFAAELAEPRVLTHGELRADNMIIDPDDRPYVIDFQNVQQECGPRELAYFITQSLETDVRRTCEERLVRRYWEGLVAHGVDDYLFDRALWQYRLAVANQFMMVVVACMRFDAVDAKSQALLATMVRRGIAAIEDNSSLALLDGAYT